MPVVMVDVDGRASSVDSWSPLGLGAHLAISFSSCRRRDVIVSSVFRSGGEWRHEETNGLYSLGNSDTILMAMSSSWVVCDCVDLGYVRLHLGAILVSVLGSLSAYIVQVSSSLLEMLRRECAPHLVSRRAVDQEKLLLLLNCGHDVVSGHAVSLVPFVDVFSIGKFLSSHHLLRRE